MYSVQCMTVHVSPFSSMRDFFKVSAVIPKTAFVSHSLTHTHTHTQHAAPLKNSLWGTFTAASTDSAYTRYADS